MDEQQPQPPDDIAAMGSPATPDALRTIVAKHQRTRTRTLGIALAVALVAGPLAGWAIGNSGGGGGQQVATGSSPAGSNADLPASVNAPADVSGAASGGAFASPATNGAKATHLFTRTTSDGITIRAYRVQPPTPPANATTSTTSPAGKAAPQQTLCPRPMTVRPGALTPAGQSGTSTGGAPPTGANPPLPPCDPGAPPICKATPAALAEVSSDAAVGQSFDPIDDKQPSDALSHLTASSFGGPEGSPAMFVTVQTGPGVATVRLRLQGNTADQMAPSGGVAVLAHNGMPSSPNDVVIEALDSSGKVIATMPVTKPGPRMAFACGSVGGPVRAYQAPLPATPPTTR